MKKKIGESRPYSWIDAYDSTPRYVAIRREGGVGNIVSVEYSSWEEQNRLLIEAELLCIGLNRGYINVGAVLDLFGFTREAHWRDASLPME